MLASSDGELLRDLEERPVYIVVALSRQDEFVDVRSASFSSDRVSGIWEAVDATFRIEGNKSLNSRVKGQCIEGRCCRAMLSEVLGQNSPGPYPLHAGSLYRWAPVVERVCQANACFQTGQPDGISGPSCLLACYSPQLDLQGTSGGKGENHGSSEGAERV